MISIDAQRKLPRYNGFQIYRGAISAEEVLRFAEVVKAGYGVGELELFTRADIVNQLPELT